MTEDSDLQAPTRDFHYASMPAMTVSIAKPRAVSVPHRTDCSRKQEQADILNKTGNCVAEEFASPAYRAASLWLTKEI